MATRRIYSTPDLTRLVVGIENAVSTALGDAAKPLGQNVQQLPLLGYPLGRVAVGDWTCNSKTAVEWRTALTRGFAPVLSFWGFHNNGLSLLLC